MSQINSHSVCRRSSLPLSLQHFREAKMISLALVSPSSAGVLLTMPCVVLPCLTTYSCQECLMGITIMVQGQPCLSCCRFDAEGLPVYTADELNVGVGGDTDQCPFDCTCCFWITKHIQCQQLPADYQLSSPHANSMLQWGMLLPAPQTVLWSPDFEIDNMYGAAIKHAR